MKNLRLSDVLPYAKLYPAEKVMRFIQTEQHSLVPLIPDTIIDALLQDSDLKSDLYWYLEISGEVDVNDFDCVHLAYASSDKLNKIIVKQHNVYSITVDPANGEGNVIGHCPWCGIRLNTSLMGPDHDLL